MAISPLLAVAGTDGRIAIGGSNLNLTKWAANGRAADLLTTNFESTINGICNEEGITGIRGCDISFEGSWDLSAPILTDPPKLKAGELIANIKLFISKTSNKFFNFTSVRILTSNVTTDINGLATVAVTGKSNGDYTFPV